nr:acetyl-CoA carboxylase biotin carboxyl carrier protein subunit [uncultured bacterium]
MTASDEDHVRPHDGARPDLLGAIARELTGLARDLPGVLRRVSVTAAGHGVEVEWETRDTTAGTAAGPDPRTDASGPAPVREPAEHSGRRMVRAPLVGTFYRAPQPGAAPFVNPGDQVEQGQTVGIVEAMKLMNPVAADRAGRVVGVLVDNGEPVEYDQPLVVLEICDAGAPA